MVRLRRALSALTAVIVLSTVSTTIASADVQLVSSLASFEARQSGLPAADDFELDFFDPEVQPDDILASVEEWGGPSRRDCIGSTVSCLGTEVLWWDRSNPVSNGAWSAFGLELSPDTPQVTVLAWWGRVVKREQVPAPFHWWSLPHPDTLQAILNLLPDYEEDVLI
ncbi:MAG: hypothetical protein GF355_01725, partial [Candidatus Eisenbacteria bacterium]|nr:hypothetical protein [Candidatus Eisenbacteria bacterium]